MSPIVSAPDSSAPVPAVRQKTALGRRQRGMTLVELLVGLAIASLISAMAVTSVHQILTASSQAKDMQLAVAQVRSAEHWMTRDLLTAQSVTLGADDGFPLELIWTDHLAQNHLVQYSMEAMPSGSLKSLKRLYIAPDLTESPFVVASYLDASQCSCASVGTLLMQVELAATSGNYTATRSFEAALRVAE